MKQCLLILMLLAELVHAQTVSVPLSHWAYDVIECWEVRGLIESTLNGTQPFTRLEMATYIQQVLQTYLNTPERFSRVDLEQLRYLTVEFKEELKILTKTNPTINSKTRISSILEKRPFSFLGNHFYRNGRNLLELHHDDFNLFADPVLSYDSREMIDEEKGKYQQTRLSNGFLFRGNLGRYMGFYFNLTDNHVRDERWKDQRIDFQVLEESGWPFLLKGRIGSWDFDENVAYLSLNYKYFYLLYGREYNQWGVGHLSNLLLSTNAQLYDQLKLVVRYWRFKFTHLTAFIQYISANARKNIKSQPHIDVYWAGNRLELDLGKGLQMGFSEAIVYGNRSLQPGYLNPMSFFKSLEHYYGDRDNGLLSLDFELRLKPGFKIFGEWLIDDISTGKIGSDFYGNKFAWQGGFLWVNPLRIPDVDLLVEYVRIKPYVYSQSFQDYNKYKHYDTILGHFIGPNSDDFYLRLRKRFSKFFTVSGEIEKYRHGSNLSDRNVGGDPDLPHRTGDAWDAPFLDGILNRQLSMGVSLQYEFIRNLFGEFHFRRIRYYNQDWKTLLSFRLSFNFGYRAEKFRNIFPLNH